MGDLELIVCDDVNLKKEFTNKQTNQAIKATNKTLANELIDTTISSNNTNSSTVALDALLAARQMLVDHSDTFQFSNVV